MFNVRDAREGDTNYVFDIDLKCFDTAWTPDDWREKSEQYRILVCTYFGTPVAVVVFREHEGAVEIAKLAVKKQFRLKGIANNLLDDVAKWANTRGLHRMSLMVPEYLADVNHPHNIIGWLIKTRFRGTSPWVAGAFSVCGEPEAGIIFERSI